MLLVLHELSQSQSEKLMKVYAGSNAENTAWFCPDCKDPAKALKEVEKAFSAFLREEFLPRPKNACYVWSEEGVWVSALRLTRLSGFYFLEALETAPDQRQKGYGEKLLKAVAQKLSQDGSTCIRDNVSKKNVASLAVHKKAGFQVEYEEAIDFLDGGRKDPGAYGMLLTIG